MAKYIIELRPYHVELADKFTELKMELVDNMHNVTGPKSYENLRALQLFKEVISVVDRAKGEEDFSANIDKYKDIKETWLPKQGGEMGKYLAQLITIKRKWI